MLVDGEGYKIRGGGLMQKFGASCQRRDKEEILRGIVK